MQTSLARRQRHRRSLDRGRPRGSSVVRRVVLVIPIVVFLAFLGVGLAGVLGVATAYNYYSQGLPDPRDTLSNLSFDQQTVLTDRTGKTKLASLGEVVDHYDQAGLLRVVNGVQPIDTVTADLIAAIDANGPNVAQGDH